MSFAPTSSAAPAPPIRGLHHFAYRCRDCEETRRFYEDVLGLPLVHALKAEQLPESGESCPYVEMFFAMGDGCCIAFFDLGDGDTALRVPDRRRWASHLALRVDSLDACKRRRRGSQPPGSTCSGRSIAARSSRSTCSTRTEFASS